MAEIDGNFQFDLYFRDFRYLPPPSASFRHLPLPLIFNPKEFVTLTVINNDNNDFGQQRLTSHFDQLRICVKLLAT